MTDTQAAPPIEAVPLLEARDLTVTRDGAAVCSGVSLRVCPGELTVKWSSVIK